MAILTVKAVYQDDTSIDTTLELTDDANSDDISDDNVIGYAEWLCKKPIKAVFRDDKQIYPNPQRGAIEVRMDAPHGGSQ